MYWDEFEELWDWDDVPEKDQILESGESEEEYEEDYEEEFDDDEF